MTTVQAVLLAKTWDQRFHSSKALYFCPTKLLQLEIAEGKKKERKTKKRKNSHKQKRKMKEISKASVQSWNAEKKKKIK